MITEEPSNPSVVLTGATGFIGSAVLAELLRQGKPVCVLVRPNSDRRRLASLTGYTTIEVTNWDSQDLGDRLVAERPATFIHCAWRGVTGEDRSAAFQITDNIPLTLDTVKLAARCGCRQWIGLGSQAEYGNPNRRLDEDASTRPTTMYGKAKLAAGIAALALCEGLGLSGAWVRVFSTYGPGDHPGWFVPYLIRQFLQGETPQLTRCEQLWDYLYVEDAARAVVSLADHVAAGVFNLGSGEAVPLKAVVETVRGALSPAIEPAYGAVAYRVDQVMHLQADITRLKETTGWYPRVPLPEGLRETVNWHLKNLK